MLLQDSTRQISTKHMGGLSAILHAEVQLVIWKRRLPGEIQTEMAMLAEMEVSANFMTLATDPVERIRHQLAKAGIRSRFLEHDLSLLVATFGELAKATRVRVWHGTARDLESRELPAAHLRLGCAYAGPGLLLPERKPAAAAAFPGNGDLLQDRLRAFSASSQLITSTGQAVLWKVSGSAPCPIAPLPSEAGSLILCLDRAG